MGINEMQTTIELPKAFSVSNESEFPIIQHLVVRLNPQLSAVQVTTGIHINGGSTVNWGLVYLDGQPPTEIEARDALAEAGFDFQHNADIQLPRIWVDHQSTIVHETTA
jgi:hypothetical protein